MQSCQLFLELKMAVCMQGVSPGLLGSPYSVLSGTQRLPKLSGVLWIDLQHTHVTHQSLLAA